ncbi:MAG: hypothetical protein WBQ25_14200 [Nitrososphaeraceae archaeon]
MKRCMYWSLSQAPLFKQLDDGKNYYWTDSCISRHYHEFVEAIE